MTCLQVSLMSWITRLNHHRVPNEAPATLYSHLFLLGQIVVEPLVKSAGYDTLAGLAGLYSLTHSVCLSRAAKQLRGHESFSLHGKRLHVVQPVSITKRSLAEHPQA